MHVSRWVTPDGSEYVINNLNFPSHLVVLAVVDSCNAIKLKHAAKHRNGKGMENGIDFNSLFQLKKSNCFKTNYQLLSAFETAVAGALWSNERVNEAYPDVSPICARCNDAVETDFHAIWLCPCNDLIDSERIRESDHFKGRAMSEVDNEPCLWLRGVLPSRLATISKDDIAQRRIFYFQGDPPPLGSWPHGCVPRGREWG